MPTREKAMTSSSECNSKNAFEWTVFGIGCVLIIATTWCLTWYALNSKDGPARILIESGTPVLEGDRFRVPIEIRNTGHRVASNVQIVISATTGATSQQAGLSIDHIPRGATRQGFVTFSGPDVPTQPKCEVTGYQQP